MYGKGQFFCPFFVFIIMNFDRIIDQFHQGEFDPEEWFGDYETFFKILHKRKLIHKLDIEDSDIQNRLLLWLREDKPSEFYDFLTDKLTDLEIDENGVVYLDLDDPSDLSRLFCNNSRYGISRDGVDSVLSSERYYDWFSSTTDDVYRDVIDNLDSRNRKFLEDSIVETLQNQTIEPETPELEEIAKEQGHNEYVTIDQSVVSRVVDDEESMNYLLKDYLSNINSDLFTIHANAYETAYEDEVLDSIWSELQEYVDGKGEFYSRPHRFKKDTMTQRFRIPVASNFEDIIVNYLEDGKGRGSRGLLEYWGDYLSLIEGELDCLTVSPSDYPDHRKIIYYMNEIFTDYI